MKTSNIIILIVSAFLFVAANVQAQQTAAANAISETNAQDQDDSVSDENDQEDTRDLSVEERLKRAQENEAPQALEEAKPAEEASGLTQAQKDKLKQENTVITTTAPAATAVETKPAQDKYNKPQHDWSFKDPLKDQHAAEKMQPPTFGNTTMKKY